MHHGDIRSTSGGVQYIRGYHDACGGYHEYIGGCLVHRRDIMSTLGDIMSTSGDVQYIGGYHNACGEQVGKTIPFLLKTPMY